jgi:hypothetical protein
LPKDHLGIDRTGMALAPGHTVCRPYRRLAWAALLAAGITAGSIALFFAQYAFPYRPTSKEATASVLALHQGATTSLNGEAMHHADAHVLVTHPLRTAQVVVSTYRQVSINQATQRQASVPYFEISVVLKYWFDGVGSKASANNTFIELPEYAAIRLASLRYDGAYAIAGGTLNPDIVRARIAWEGGGEITAPLRDGVFFFVREDGAEAAWVSGLDAQGNAVNNSLAFPYASTPPQGYVTEQHITVTGGIVIAGAFSLPGADPQECIELTYLTAENARKYLTGGGALVGQRACMAPGAGPSSGSLGPSALTVVNNDTIVVGGRILDSAATRVGLIWSDGVQQTVMLQDGLYLAQRPGTALRIEHIVVSDEP